MSVSFYADEHYPGPIIRGLARRGVNVLTVQDDGRTGEKDDAVLLDRATALGRVTITCDQDFLVEAAHRQQSGRTFGGIIYAVAKEISIGRCVQDLDVIAKLGEPHEYADRVEYLPL